MSASDAIASARALLATFSESDWLEAFIVSGDQSLFIARDGGGANPMRAAAPLEDTPAETTAPPQQLHEVKAPHVLTVVSVALIGAHVSEGDNIAMIRVLDTEIVIAASATGTIVAAADAGALVEYDHPIATIAA